MLAEWPSKRLWISTRVCESLFVCVFYFRSLFSDVFSLEFARNCFVHRGASETIDSHDSFGRCRLHFVLRVWQLQEAYLYRLERHGDLSCM